MSGRQRLIAVLSPIPLIAVCRAAQYVAGPILGVWSWLPTLALFWVLIGLLIAVTRGPDAPARWLQPAQGGRFWCVLALLLGLVSLPGFVAHYRVMQPPTVLCLSVAFALINPWFEEGYFRGLLLDATEAWRAPVSVAYSAFWFAVSHPLVWGVHSVPMRHWVVLPALGGAGALWAIAYRRSRSLRWPIAGHACAILFGLSVPVLLNRHVPYGP
jgi:uncharacterized protein